MGSKKDKAASSEPTQVPPVPADVANQGDAADATPEAEAKEKDDAPSSERPKCPKCTAERPCSMACFKADGYEPADWIALFGDPLPEDAGPVNVEDPPAPAPKRPPAPEGHVICRVTSTLLHNGQRYEQDHVGPFPKVIADSCPALEVVEG